MNHITYRIVEHDGGWTYNQVGTLTATHRTHDQARAAAVIACREWDVPGELAHIEFQNALGERIAERADGDDRPDVDITG